MGIFKPWRHEFFCLFIGAVLAGAPAPAEEVRRVDDLATGFVARGSGTGPMASLGAEAGHRFVFAAEDGRHGRELWVSDGSEESTRMLLDLCPGRCASNPRRLTRVGARAFFFATDGAWPNALYVTDGTAAGTRRVHELGDVEVISEVAIAMGDLFLFAPWKPERGHELYRSDGTREGTRLIADQCPGACSPSFLESTVTSQGLFFAGYGASVLHLDRAATTFKTVPICATDYCVARMGEIDGQLILITREDQQNKLRRLVDLTGTTQVLRSFESGVSFFSDMVRSGGKLYFTVERNEATRLYRTDGTVAGSIDAPGQDTLYAAEFELLVPRGVETPLLLIHGDGRLYVYRDGVGSHQISPNSPRPLWVGAANAAGAIFFHLQGTLWWVDAADFTSHSLSPELYFGFDRTLAELANGDVALRVEETEGLEPYRIGLGGGASGRIRNIADESAGPSANPSPFAAALGFLAVLDAERWEADPSAANLFHLDDAATQASLATSQVFDPIGATSSGRLFLRHQAAARELWSHDGHAAIQVPNAVSVSLEPWATAIGGDRLYFTTDQEGQDVWTSDGTVEGTLELHDPNPDWQGGCMFTCEPGLDRRLPYQLLGDATEVFASTRVEYDRFELWRSATLPGSATRLAAGEHEFLPSIHWQGTLYYTLLSVVGPALPTWQLWASDGSVAGTRLLRELPEYPWHVPPYGAFSSIVSGAAGVGETAFLALNWKDLWRSDGTAAGTTRVYDFAEGARIVSMTGTGSRLYLAVATPALGAELWVSDGTTAGTRLLRDLYPGPLGSHPSELQALADGRLLFAADDGVHGHEAWITDGTPSGTRMIADLGPGASSPGHWAVKGHRVVFAADAGIAGRELYTTELASYAPCPVDRLCLHDDRFEVRVDFVAPDGAGVAQRALSSRESGVLTFFNADNWEVSIKVLDGCAINDRFWVFAAASTNVEHTLTVLDRATGLSKVYPQPGGALAAPITDTAAFATCAAAPPEPAYGPGADFPQAARLCPGEPDALCLGADQRFRVRVAWETTDQAGAAQPVPYGSTDSGLFTFFSPDNWELMVKVLDGCALNQHHWLFAAGTTDVGWTLTLEDRLGQLPPKTYVNPPGVAGPAIGDTAALACTP